MALTAAGSAGQSRKRKLNGLLEIIPEVLEEAIDACSAPRHNREEREEYGKILRRKWFGRKRGTVRHTFRDILAHINSRGVFVNTKGSQCVPGASAYTPDDQMLNIYLCEKFYTESVIQQVATIVHELTHLVRKTIDFEPPVNDDMIFNFTSTVDLISSSIDSEAVRKDYYQNTFSQNKNSARSAYSFQYFIEELVGERFGSDLPARVN